MNWLVGYAVILIVLAALVGGNATYLLQLFVLILIIGAAMHIMFKRRMPKRFGENMMLLIFGPSLLICLLSMILSKIPGGRFNINWFMVILVVFLLVYSWYGWRRWQNRKRGQTDQYQLRGSEREFILPYSNRSDPSRNSAMDDEI